MNVQIHQMIMQYKATTIAPPLESWIILFNAPIEPFLDETWGTPPVLVVAPVPPPKDPMLKD